MASFVLNETSLLSVDIPSLPGVTVTGTFHCRKSEDNSREIDVELQYRVHRGGANADDSPLVVQSFKVC